MSDTSSSPPVSYRKPAAAEPPAKPAAPSALDQLQASRARVRSELERIAHPPAKPSLFSQGGDLEEKVKRFLLGLPGVASATEVAQS